MPGYTLVKPSTPLINGTALWHIVVVSVAAGCGLALAFGLILLGTEYFGEGKNPSIKGAGGALAVGAAAFCLAAIGLGVYVMANPTSSKPAQVVPTGMVHEHVAPVQHSALAAAPAVRPHA